MANFSKTQIDRLGDRLKVGGRSHDESDLRLLDDYRRSFGDAYDYVDRIVRERGQSPTGRPAKSTVSIAEKLRRESIRLSQMQDIAGCRVVVTDVLEQERVVALLGTAFPGASVMDRRDNPSHGYRAVHIIAEISGKPIEIQVRSFLQDLWASLSEKSSDVLDPTIKYGGGPDSWRHFLTKSSESVAAYENLEKVVVASLEVFTKKEVAAYEVFKKTVAELPGHHITEHDETTMRAKWQNKIEAEKRRLVGERNRNADLLSGAISWLDKLKEQER